MPQQSARSVRRYVVAHDVHFPFIHMPTFRAMLELIRDIKPAGFVFGGDQFDNAEISHHNQGKPLFKPQGSYLRNREQFDKLILTPIEQALFKQAERVWITGNHERFEQDLIESKPELEGVVDSVRILRLEHRGWEVIPLGHSKKLGELHIIHGECLTGFGNQGPTYAARKAVELYSANVLAGHTHAPQSFTKVSPVDAKRKFGAWIAPILGTTNPSYIRNRPTAWLTGFTVVELWEGGLFNLYPVLTFKGQCAYAGKLYGSKHSK